MQSSSTSTSIIVGLVSANVPVRTSIPMIQSFLKAVEKLSQSCLKAVSKFSRSCLKDFSKLSQSCLKVFSKLSRSCLNAVSKLSPKLSQSFLKVRTAIPMILGANIGTSVTNTIVSFTQVQNRDEFRRYKQPWSSG